MICSLDMSSAPRSFGRHMLEHWMLDPTITYLNHGTVGAPPKPVLAAQQAIRDEIERQPSRFLLRELVTLVGSPSERPSRLRRAAAAVAEFVGVPADDLVFVDNATTGVNAVLRSLGLRAGDEIVITSFAYGATANVAAFVAQESGAHVRTIELPRPIHGCGGLVDAVASALGSRTRIAVIDHITSESALIMPVAEIAALCRARDVPVLVDGAHAPGTLPLDLDALGVDWYVGNLHKWAFAPRSCGILWADRDRQAHLHPPVISWGLGKGFTAEFDWVGTRDPSPYLAAPDGIAFMRELGESDVRAYNHALAWQGAQLLGERLETTLGVDERLIGAMATVPLPQGFGSTAADAARLRDALLFDDRIEVQVHASHGRICVRLSGQVYNDMADVERLAESLAARASVAG